MSKTQSVRSALKKGYEFTPRQGVYQFGFSSTKALSTAISALRRDGLNIHFVPRTNSMGDTYTKYSLRARARRRA